MGKREGSEIARRRKSKYAFIKSEEMRRNRLAKEGLPLRKEMART